MIIKQINLIINEVTLLVQIIGAITSALFNKHVSTNSNVEFLLIGKYEFIKFL
jgi:hypothetical protein